MVQATDAESPIQRLKDWLCSKTGVGIAFSGGMDSSFLAAAAAHWIPNRTELFFLDSALISRSEAETAQSIALALGFALTKLEVNVLDLPCFQKHPPDRCYHCKKHLFSQLKAKMSANWVLCDGSNLDDLSEHRPGAKALHELQIESPLLSCGFSKDEIRRELTCWNLTSLIKAPSP